MFGGGHAARPVRGADRGRVQGGGARRVDDDERDAEDPQLLVEHRFQRRGDEDDTVGGTGPEVAHPLAGVPRTPVDGRHHRADPGRVRDLLDPADDLHGPGAVEVVEYQVEQGRTGARGRGALAVAVPAQQLLDPRPVLWRHVGPAVDDPGHGRHGHAGLPGDLRDRDLALGVGLTCCHLPHLRRRVTAKLPGVFRKTVIRGKAYEPGTGSRSG